MPAAVATTVGRPVRCRCLGMRCHVASAQLGETHGMVVAFLPGHQSGEALAAAMDQIEPPVLSQWGVAVYFGGEGEKLRHRLDVAVAHVALHLEVRHLIDGIGAQ